jgi:hypothetical protein
LWGGGVRIEGGGKYEGRREIVGWVRGGRMRMVVKKGDGVGVWVGDMGVRVYYCGGWWGG